MTGVPIPPGEGALITLSFTDYADDAICFAYNDCSSACINIIASIEGTALDSDWGECYTPSEECEGQMGDMNNDDALNILDLVVIINLILNGGDYSPCGDINEDEILNIIDLVGLANIILDNP